LVKITPEQDRARGALMGLACGDAVGTTVEFENPGSFAPLTDMIGGGPFRLKAGQWTDDTSMALCLAESIVDTGRLDLADQLRRYVLWRKTGYLASNGRCFDIGAATSQQLRRFERTGESVDPRPDQEQAANGSLMRLAAVPIKWWQDPAEAAAFSAESSRTTHAAQRPVDACRALGAMIAALIAGEDAEAVFAPEFWRWGSLHAAVEAVVRGSWRGKEPPRIRGTGYCIDALEASIWATASARDFRDAILRAANLGDDADTTAAITGQLAGARWGFSKIPAEWRSRVAMSDRIVSLADALFGEAAEPPAIWTYDRFIHAWWVEPGRVLAGEYPGDPKGGLTKIDVLIDAGIRTFLNLTTQDDSLVPYVEGLSERRLQRRLELRHVTRPIPDLRTVSDDVYDEIVNTIRSEVDFGRPTYVHCWGGVGRTGTVVGCLLADRGLSMDEVMRTLGRLRSQSRKANRECPETPSQLEVIRRRCR
jgi:ADP-ribosylglycohydrolase